MLRLFQASVDQMTIQTLLALCGMLSLTIRARLRGGLTTIRFGFTRHILIPTADAFRPVLGLFSTVQESSLFSERLAAPKRA